jgi:hypothetical protein
MSNSNFPDNTGWSVIATTIPTGTSPSGGAWTATNSNLVGQSSDVNIYYSSDVSTTPINSVNFSPNITNTTI